MASSTLTGPIRIAQINRTYYVGEAFLSTIQKAVTFAVGTGYPGDVIIPVEYAGSDSIPAVTGGASNVYIMDQRAGAKDLYAWNGTAYALQPLTAATAEFDNCIVDDSPVRTFANTPDGPGQGMVWPDIGIPVSQGSTWQSPSIDPNTVPRISGTPVTPPAGVSYVNIGATAGTELPFEEFCNVNAGFNQKVWENYIANDGSLNCLLLDDALVNSAPWLSVTRNGLVPGVANFSCPIAGEDTVTVYGEVATLDFGRSNVCLRSGPAPYAPCISFINMDAAVDSRYSDIVAWPGGMQFRFGSDSGAATPWLTADRSGPNPLNIIVNGYSSTAATLAVGDGQYGLSSSSGALFLWSSGNTVVPTGDLHVAGGVYGSTKNFRIPHPTKDDMLLTHSSLEGPEIAVFYRGEGETVDGVATIMLPDYFEALTREEGRTVQLTEIFEDDDAPNFGNFLAAGRVRDGMFQVRSKDSEAKFYWEVKAIRADVDELEVETEWPEDDKSIAR